MKNPSERIALVCGYFLGVFTGLISFLRNSRMFHPRGRLFRATVIGDDLFPKECLFRISSAWWKEKVWPDVLGISLRFETSEGKQDLLFATIRKPWLTPLGPFTTHFKNYFKNSYFAVSPFILQGQVVRFMIDPQRNLSHGQSRDELLDEALSKGTANFRLLMQDYRDKWVMVATISLQQEIFLDQDQLKFNPFHSALGISPKGFVHHLRIGAYSMGQKARDLRARTLKSKRHLDRGSVLPS